MLIVKRVIRKLVKVASDWLYADVEDQPIYRHPRYVETNELYLRIVAEIYHPYAWGVVQSAILSKSLSIPGISVIEFGVAGGNSLVALERISSLVSRYTGIDINVYGFDTGCGLPPSADPRDLPHICSSGNFTMNEDKLRQRLHGASLLLGQVKDTLGDFIRSKPYPIGFISFDMDYYSSTKDAIKILEPEEAILMPRVYCFFDDIFACGDFDGERLAIKEFNQRNLHRKVSQIYGLRSLVPRKYRESRDWEKYHMAYIFDHSLYSCKEWYSQRQMALK